MKYGKYELMIKIPEETKEHMEFFIQKEGESLEIENSCFSGDILQRDNHETRKCD